MRILIVEPDAATARSLELAMSHANLNAFVSDCGMDAVDLMRLYDYDLVTLETHLPDMSGLDVVRRVRASKITTPVLMLSGDDSTNTKLAAFGAGADDYLSKPFHREELIARIFAITRRARGLSQNIVTIGRLTINFGSKTCSVGDQKIHLTVKEYEMLELMALRKGATVTKEMFLNHLYRGQDEPEIKIIDVFVCKLRKKLVAATGGESYIHTNWGRGYILVDADTVGRVAQANAAAHRSFEDTHAV